LGSDGRNDHFQRCVYTQRSWLRDLHGEFDSGRIYECVRIGHNYGDGTVSYDHVGHGRLLSHVDYNGTHLNLYADGDWNRLL